MSSWLDMELLMTNTVRLIRTPESYVYHHQPAVHWNVQLDKQALQWRKMLPRGGFLFHAESSSANPNNALDDVHTRPDSRECFAVALLSIQPWRSQERIPTLLCIGLSQYIHFFNEGKENGETSRSLLFLKMALWWVWCLSQAPLI